MKRLSELRGAAVVVGFEQNSALVRRLESLGICKGEKIEFWGKLPWGSPLIFKVQTHLVSLRYKEAEGIYVDAHHSSEAAV